MATKKYVSQKQRNTRVIITAVILAVVLSVGAVIGASFIPKWIQSGTSARSQIALKSDNYKVNNCMMTYYYLTDFYNFYNQNAMYMQYMGLDLTKSLNEQSYDEQNSWFSYFVNNSANTVTAYLLYAEEARANDFKVDDISAKIDREIDNLKKNAETAKVELEQYLVNLFGYGIKETDVRDALELQIYATEYYSKVESDYSGSLTSTEFEEYYNINRNSLNKVDYLSYTVNADVATDADEATKNAAYADAKATAESLKTAATSKEAYIAWVSAHLTEKNADLETPLTEEEIKTTAEKVSVAQAYIADSELSEWAFDAERKVGDVNLIDNGNGGYTVYLMDKTAYRVEDTTRDVRHILIMTGEGVSDDQAKAKADRILATYLAGDKTAEAFDALATENNEDSNSLYEGVAKGQMVAEFENWLFDEARAEGDTGIVKTQYGYHVMYYAGEGRAQWKNDAYNAMFETYITKVIEEWQDEYPVDVNSQALAALPATIPQTAFAQPET